MSRGVLYVVSFAASFLVCSVIGAMLRLWLFG